MFTKCSIFAALFALTAACSAAAPSPQPDEQQQAQTQKVEQAAPTDKVETAEADEDSDFVMARHGNRQNRIQRFDTNHDGMLQANEVPERLRTWFTAADANHDNVVTLDELRAYRRAHRGQHQGHGQHAQGQTHASDTSL